MKLKERGSESRKWQKERGQDHGTNGKKGQDHGTDEKKEGSGSWN